jgi:hypothetical protein
MSERTMSDPNVMKVESKGYTEAGDLSNTSNEKQDIANLVMQEDTGSEVIIGFG